MRRLIFLVISPIIIAILAEQALAQTERPLELEDYYALKSVSSPSISPTANG